MSEEVDTGELTNTTFNGFITKYEEFVKFLKDCVTEIGVLKSLNEELKEENVSLKRNIDGFKKENDHLKQYNQTLIYELQNRPAPTSLMSEVDQLTNENNRLKDELQSLDFLKEEMIVLQTENASLQEERNMIRTELMEVRNENDILQNRMLKNQKAMDTAMRLLHSTSMNGVSVSCASNFK